MYRINRRVFLGLSVGAAVSGLAIARARQVKPTFVPAGTPSATPEPGLEIYDGPLLDIWDAPWLTEGKAVEFDAIILQRDTAPDGQVISIGHDGLTARSLVLLQVPSAQSRNIFAATDGDLSAITNARTAHIVGVFGGLHGPGWTAPVIIASTIQNPD